MEPWQSETTSLASRASFILNKDLFSDVRFLVGPDNIEYPAHKLLLCLASPVFEKRFQETPANVITDLKVPDVIPIAFFKMLKYIYTDTLDLDDIQDARDVLAVAEKFKIHHLQTLCRNYIDQRIILPQYACKMYDIATDLEMNSVKLLCQCTFLKQTEEVLKSSGFLRAKLSTVEVLVQSNTLSVDELTLLKAIIQWGRAKCHRAKVPDNGMNIRMYINPLIRYIRFLTLSIEKLQSFVSEWGTILLPTEVCAITMNVSLNSFNASEFPETLSCNMCPRCEPEMSSCSSVVASPKKSNICSNVQVKRNEPLKSKEVKFLNNDSSETFPKIYASEPQVLSSARAPIFQSVSTVVESQLINGLTTKYSSSGNIEISQQQFTNSLNALKPSNDLVLGKNLHLSDLLPQNEVPVKSETRPTNVARKRVMIRSDTQDDTDSDSDNKSDSDLDSDSEESVDSQPNGINPICTSFKMNLIEPKQAADGIKLVDISTKVQIDVTAGDIELIGLTIKIKQNASMPNDVIFIILRLIDNSGSYEQVEEETVSEIITILFNKPLRCSSGQSATIAVHLEDIQLYRCSLCNLLQFPVTDETMQGNVVLSGNQKKQDGYLPCLIDRVLFRHC